MREYHYASGAVDRELTAALHVLDAPILRDRVAEHVDVAGRGIDFQAILEEPWSNGERSLIEMACSIWGRSEIADGRLSDLLHGIDRESFVRVLEAIQVRRADV